MPTSFRSAVSASIEIESETSWSDENPRRIPLTSFPGQTGIGDHPWRWPWRTLPEKGRKKKRDRETWEGGRRRTERRILPHQGTPRIPPNRDHEKYNETRHYSQNVGHPKIKKQSLDVYISRLAREWGSDMSTSLCELPDTVRQSTARVCNMQQWQRARTACEARSERRINAENLFLNRVSDQWPWGRSSMRKGSRFPLHDSRK